MSSRLKCERDRHAIVSLEHRVEVLTETTDLLYKGEDEMCCADQFLTSDKKTVIMYCVIPWPIIVIIVFYCRATYQLETETKNLRLILCGQMCISYELHKKSVHVIHGDSIAVPKLDNLRQYFELDHKDLTK